MPIPIPVVASVRRRSHKTVCTCCRDCLIPSNVDRIQPQQPNPTTLPSQAPQLMVTDKKKGREKSDHGKPTQVARRLKRWLLHFDCPNQRQEGVRWGEAKHRRTGASLSRRIWMAPVGQEVQDPGIWVQRSRLSSFGVGEGKGRGRRAIRCQLKALVSHHPVRGAWGCQGARHLDWTKLAHTPLRAEPPLERRWGSIAASEAIPIRVQTHLHVGSLTNASTANCVRC
jgi:hypothetical protein